jgi:hypothetical protein
MVLFVNNKRFSTGGEFPNIKVVLINLIPFKLSKGCVVPSLKSSVQNIPERFYFCFKPFHRLYNGIN